MQVNLQKISRAKISNKFLFYGDRIISVRSALWSWDATLNVFKKLVSLVQFTTDWGKKNIFTQNVYLKFQFVI